MENYGTILVYKYFSHIASNITNGSCFYRSFFFSRHRGNKIYNFICKQPDFYPLNYRFPGMLKLIKSHGHIFEIDEKRLNRLIRNILVLYSTYPSFACLSLSLSPYKESNQSKMEKGMMTAPSFHCSLIKLWYYCDLNYGFPCIGLETFSMRGTIALK